MSRITYRVRKALKPMADEARPRTPRFVRRFVGENAVRLLCTHTSGEVKSKE